MEALKGRPPDTDPRSFGRAVVKQVGAELPSPPTSLRSPRTSAEQVGITWDLACCLSRPRPEQVGAELRSRKLTHLRLTMKAADLGLAMVKYEKAQARSPWSRGAPLRPLITNTPSHRPGSGQLSRRGRRARLPETAADLCGRAAHAQGDLICPDLPGSRPSRRHLVVISLHLAPSRSTSFHLAPSRTVSHRLAPSRLPLHRAGTGAAPGAGTGALCERRADTRDARHLV